MEERELHESNLGKEKLAGFADVWCISQRICALTEMLRMTQNNDYIKANEALFKNIKISILNVLRAEGAALANLPLMPGAVPESNE
ncbi:MAG: hypothetical protein LBS24_07385 [Clostridiales Family XIII bacterium]|jgi:hypothetical protein|nr:hypothetical protein [Clostridiales Family XIII bacterium]